MPEHQSIPQPVAACPLPCVQGYVFDFTLSHEVGVQKLAHPPCAGSGLMHQARYAPVDRLRRMAGWLLGDAGAGISGDLLDRLAQGIAEEAVRIAEEAAEAALLHQAADQGEEAARNTAQVLRKVLAPLRLPLAYASCVSCATTGIGVYGTMCGACDGRGFLPSRARAAAGLGEGPPQ